MDNSLTKPVRPAELWPAIDRVMKTHSPGKPAGLELLDVPARLASCGRNASLLGKMCQLFQTKIPDHLAALRNQDAPRLREVARRFGGLLSEFSTLVGDRAGRLQDLASSISLHSFRSLDRQLISR